MTAPISRFSSSRTLSNLKDITVMGVCAEPFRSSIGGIVSRPRAKTSKKVGGTEKSRAALSRSGFRQKAAEFPRHQRFGGDFRAALKKEDDFEPSGDCPASLIVVKENDPRVEQKMLEAEQTKLSPLTRQELESVRGLIRQSNRLPASAILVHRRPGEGGRRDISVVGRWK